MSNPVGGSFSPMDSEHSQIIERQVAVRGIKDPAVKDAAIRVLQEHPNLDPKLYMNQIHAESRFNQAAVSPVGALGVGQIMPSTAQRYGADLTQIKNDPYENLSLSAKIMEDNLKATGGNYAAALAYYNGGQRGRRAYESGNPNQAAPETQRYVAQILGDGVTSTPAQYDAGNMTKNPANYSNLSNSSPTGAVGPMSQAQARDFARSLMEIEPSAANVINDEEYQVGKRLKGNI